MIILKNKYAEYTQTPGERSALSILAEAIITTGIIFAISAGIYAAGAAIFGIGGGM